MRRSGVLDSLTLSFGSCTFFEQTVSSTGAIVWVPAPFRQGQSFVSMQSSEQELPDPNRTTTEMRENIALLSSSPQLPPWEFAGLL